MAGMVIFQENIRRRKDILMNPSHSDQLCVWYSCLKL